MGYRWRCTWVERLREIQLRFWYGCKDQYILSLIILRTSPKHVLRHGFITSHHLSRSVCQNVLQQQVVLWLELDEQLFFVFWFFVLVDLQGAFAHERLWEVQQACCNVNTSSEFIMEPSFQVTFVNVSQDKGSPEHIVYWELQTCMPAAWPPPWQPHWWST